MGQPWLPWKSRVDAVCVLQGVGLSFPLKGQNVPYETGSGDALTLLKPIILLDLRGWPGAGTAVATVFVVG
jgi:hypothetical protein